MAVPRASKSQMLLNIVEHQLGTGPLPLSCLRSTGHLGPSGCEHPPTHSTLTPCTPAPRGKTAKWLAKVCVCSLPYPTVSSLVCLTLFCLTRGGCGILEVALGTDWKQCLIFFFKSTFSYPILLISSFFLSSKFYH